MQLYRYSNIVKNLSIARGTKKSRPAFAQNIVLAFPCKPYFAGFYRENRHNPAGFFAKRRPVAARV